MTEITLPKVEDASRSDGPRTGRRVAADTALKLTAVILALVLVSIATFVPLSQNDFWVQAAVGRIIAETGHIPHTLLFPFTWAKDNQFYAHEWLPSIGFYFLLDRLGYDNLLFVQGALGLLLYALCFDLARRECQSTGMAILLACMAMAVENYRHFLRPEIVALVLLLAELHLLTLYRKHGRRYYLVACLPIALIWANSHGSFLLGFTVAAMFALGEAIESVRHSTGHKIRHRLRSAASVAAPYAILAIAMVATSLINPRGSGLFSFVASVSNSEVFKAGIGEWHPTFSRFWSNMPGFSIFVGCAVITAILMTLFWRRIRATEVILLIFFLTLASSRLRYPVFFGFISMFAAAGWMSSDNWRLAFERLALGTSTLISAIGITLLLKYGNANYAFPYYVSSPSLTPEMISRLSAPGIQGNVINSYELGAELIYRFYPRLKPSIDSRADAYGERYLLFHQKLLTDGQILKAFTNEFDVRYMLLSWENFESVKSIPGIQDTWRMSYADHKDVLLVRRQPSSAAASAPASGASASR